MSKTFLTFTWNCNTLKWKTIRIVILGEYSMSITCKMSVLILWDFPPTVHNWSGLNISLWPFFLLNKSASVRRNKTKCDLMREMRCNSWPTERPTMRPRLTLMRMWLVFQNHFSFFGIIVKQYLGQTCLRLRVNVSGTTVFSTEWFTSHGFVNVKILLLFSCLLSHGIDCSLFLKLACYLFSFQHSCFREWNVVTWFCVFCSQLLPCMLELIQPTCFCSSSYSAIKISSSKRVYNTIFIWTFLLFEILLLYSRLHVVD